MLAFCLRLCCQNCLHLIKLIKLQLINFKAYFGQSSWFCILCLKIAINCYFSNLKSAKILARSFKVVCAEIKKLFMTSSKADLKVVGENNCNVFFWITKLITWQNGGGICGWISWNALDC